MASSATRASLSIICLMIGTAEQLIAEKRFSRIDMQKDLEKFYLDSKQARDNFTNDLKSRDIGILEKSMKRWSEQVSVMTLPKTSETAVLVTVALTALTDMLAKLKNKRKIALVAPLLEPLERFHDFVDPQGRKFTSYEVTDALLNSFYQETGFIV